MISLAGPALLLAQVSRRARAETSFARGTQGSPSRSPDPLERTVRNARTGLRVDNPKGGPVRSSDRLLLPLRNQPRARRRRACRYSS
jgi:hypothetical protein